MRDQTIFLANPQQKIQITGTYIQENVTLVGIFAEHNGLTYQGIFQPNSRFTCEIPFVDINQYIVNIKGSAKWGMGSVINSNLSVRFNVRDNVPPTLTIAPLQLIDGINLPIPEGGSQIQLKGSAEDPFGIDNVNLIIIFDNVTIRGEHNIPVDNNTHEWKLQHFFEPSKIGSYKIVLTGNDRSSNATTAQTIFTTIDNTGPQILVDEPVGDNWEFEIKPETTIVLQGRTLDGQKGVKNLRINFSTVNPSPSEFLGSSADRWVSEGQEPIRSFSPQKIMLVTRASPNVHSI